MFKRKWVVWTIGLLLTAMSSGALFSCSFSGGSDCKVFCF